MADRTELLVLLDKGSNEPRPSNLVLAEDALVIEEVEEQLHSVKALCASCLGRNVGVGERLEYQRILNCTLDEATEDGAVTGGARAAAVVLTALTSIDAKRGRVLTLRGELQGANDSGKAEAWVEDVMRRAYKDVKPHRRLHVLLNPFGGPGNGRQIWRTKVEPVFAAAGCQVDITITERRYHAIEIGETIDVDRYDALVCVSGDGLIHELINGLGKRADAEHALRAVSIGAIPAGSANALVVNIQGPAHSHNPTLAALNVVKGRPLPLDLCSVTQQPKDGAPVERSLSFISFAFGLMADVDIGTEHMRWMGGTRFMVGYLQGALANRKHRCRLEIQVVEDDKDRIRDGWLKRRQAIKAGKQPIEDGSTSNGAHAANDAEVDKAAETDGPHPSLRFGDVTTDLAASSAEWTTIEQDLTTVYAGTLPFVAAELMQFPVKLSGDDSVDVAVMDSPSTMRALLSVDGAEKGSIFRNPDVRYFKARAFRLTPLPSARKSYCVVDGEEFAYRPIQFEVHAGLTSVLSMQAGLADEGMPDDL